MISIILYLIIIIAYLLWWELLLILKSIFAPIPFPYDIEDIMIHGCTRVLQLTKIWLRIPTKIHPYDNFDIPPHCIVLSNHQSFFDITMLKVCFPHHGLRFVAKQELATHYFPTIARILRTQGHALINRHSNFHTTLKEISNLAYRTAKSIQSHGSSPHRLPLCPVVFPEGTRSRDGNVGTFHTGIMHRVWHQVPLPIVVVAIDGGYRISGFQRSVLQLKSGTHTKELTLRLKVVAKFPAPQTKQELIETVAKSRAAIVTQLDRWRAT